MASREDNIKSLLWAGGIAALALLAIVYRPSNTHSSDVGPSVELSLAQKPRVQSQIKAKLAADAKSYPQNYLTLSNTTTSRGPFGTELMLSGTLKNVAPVSIKDPQITCELYAENGLPLGSVSEKVIKVVGPGKSVQFKNANMGFADMRWRRYSCSLISATVIDAAGRNFGTRKR